MEHIGNIIDKKEYLKPKPNVFGFKSTEREFADYLLITGTELVQKENKDGKFEIDDFNKKQIRQLYYYLTGNEKFEGDLTKGLMFVGGFGSGKTTMAKLIMYLYQDWTNKVGKFFSTVDIHKLYQNDSLLNNPYLNIETAPLILDELGREEYEIKIFGTTHRPIEELIQRRYITQAFLICTSNYSLESLKKKYSDFVVDRLRQLVNVIELDCKSRRK